MYTNHGGDWFGFQNETGLEPLDFSVNLCPLGTPSEALIAARRELENSCRYPDPFCRQLKHIISAKEHIPEHYILCGNGAADLIYKICFALKPAHALITAPTFSEYELALRASGTEPVVHTLLESNQFHLDESILSEIQPNMLVFLCEPNNPTGIVSPLSLLKKILNKCTEVNSMLVVDESFHDFLPAAHSMKSYLSNDHLIILRSLTKIYGLANLRVGYLACSNIQTLHDIRCCGQSWPVSGPAQAAAAAALQVEGWAEKVNALVSIERAYLQKKLTELGCKVFDGQANFLLFYSDTPELFDQLKQHGILIRDCSNYVGLCPGYYRIAVKKHEENVRLISTLAEIIHT